MILSRLFSGSKNKQAKKLKYEEGFAAGFELAFSKAWDMQLPHLQYGFNKMKEDLITNAKMETLKGLQGALRGKHGTTAE